MFSNLDEDLRRQLAGTSRKSVTTILRGTEGYNTEQHRAHADALLELFEKAI